MAVPAKRPAQRADHPGVVHPPERNNGMGTASRKLSPTQVMAAQLFAQGHDIPTVARSLMPYIVPKKKGTKKEKLKAARSRLRAWRRTERFRDAIWEWTVIQAEHALPEVMAGVTRKAAAGRVDAAKLVLEITGRHTPGADVVPAAVQIVLGDIPRPQLNGPLQTPPEDPDEVIDDAEWQEEA